VRHIVGSAKMGIGLCAACNTIRLKLANEQQNLSPFAPVMDITLAGRRIIRCRALVLPIEQALIDRVVVVHGCRRVILIGLIPRHKEHIQLPFGQPLKALTHRRRFRENHSHQQLIEGDLWHLNYPFSSESNATGVSKVTTFP